MIHELLAAALLASGPAASQPCADPSFALPVDLGIPVEERWPQLKTADVDGDGRQDLLVLLGSGQVVVFWNRAGGLVRGPSTDQLPGFPGNRFLLEPADLNGDGRVDLFVGVSSAEASAQRFESWLGDGVGGFSKAASGTLPSGLGSGLTLVRFDGGVVPDVLSVARSAADASKLEVLRWRGRGDGTFQAPAAVLTLDNPIPGAGVGGVVAGDVDGDGRTDLVVSSVGNAPSHPEVHPRYSYVSGLWLGDGVGGFQSSSPAPYGWAFRLVDVDGDGRDEVLYANWQRMPVISDAGFLRREADGTWRALERGSSMPRPSSSASSTGIPRAKRCSLAEAPTGSAKPAAALSGTRRFRRSCSRRCWTWTATATSTSSASRGTRSVPPTASSWPEALAERVRGRRRSSSRRSCP
ncbi:MAG: VCBS repeat-containing protein [Holophagales bacterium]|nr:VCBS repeat-containing protein [Holophagales bacterium]